MASSTREPFRRSPLLVCTSSRCRIASRPWRSPIRARFGPMTRLENRIIGSITSYSTDRSLNRSTSPRTQPLRCNTPRRCESEVRSRPRRPPSRVGVRSPLASADIADRYRARDDISESSANKYSSSVNRVWEGFNRAEASHFPKSERLEGKLATC